MPIKQTKIQTLSLDSSAGTATGTGNFDFDVNPLELSPNFHSEPIINVRSTTTSGDPAGINVYATGRTMYKNTLTETKFKYTIITELDYDDATIYDLSYPLHDGYHGFKIDVELLASGQADIEVWLTYNG
jgi:hypothetical protein